MSSEQDKCKYCSENDYCIYQELDRSYMCLFTVEELKELEKDISIDKNNKI